MTMSHLSIFANFRIDSEERFLRMKDSFYSFHNANIKKWIINVRGDYAEDTIKFLKSNINSDSLKIFNNESGKGWFYDTNNLIKWIDSQLIMIWIEDQICMCGPDKLDLIIEDMYQSNVDYMGYTWFGLGTFIKEFNNIIKCELNSIWYVK